MSRTMWIIILVSILLILGIIAAIIIFILIDKNKKINVGITDANVTSSNASNIKNANNINTKNINNFTAKSENVQEKRMVQINNKNKINNKNVTNNKINSNFSSKNNILELMNKIKMKKTENAEKINSKTKKQVKFEEPKELKELKEPKELKELKELKIIEHEEPKEFKIIKYEENDYQSSYYERNKIDKNLEILENLEKIEENEPKYLWGIFENNVCPQHWEICDSEKFAIPNELYGKLDDKIVCKTLLPSIMDYSFVEVRNTLDGCIDPEVNFPIDDDFNIYGLAIRKTFDKTPNSVNVPGDSTFCVSYGGCPSKEFSICIS